jgi:hypothetical protein
VSTEFFITPLRHDGSTVEADSLRLAFPLLLLWQNPTDTRKATIFSLWTKMFLDAMAIANFSTENVPDFFK